MRHSTRLSLPRIAVAGSAVAVVSSAVALRTLVHAMAAGRLPA